MFLCMDYTPHACDKRVAITYQRESERPVEYRLSVANQTLHIVFDDARKWSGHILRPTDGLEASFSNRMCLEHLIEGLIGRRAWPQYRSQVQTILDQFHM